MSKLTPQQAWEAVSQVMANAKRLTREKNGQGLIEGIGYDAWTKVLDWPEGMTEYPPSKPAYRPFANAQEFKPHRDRWVRYKNATDGNKWVSRVQTYRDDKCFIGDVYFYWGEAFKDLEFDDGEPFGVRVEG